MEPGKNLLDALRIGKTGVELQIVSGANSLYVGFGTYPKETSGAHALLLGQNPERSSAVPGAVADGLRVVIAIDLFPGRIIKAVGHNAMMLRVEAGHDRVMVGKSDGG